MHHLDLEKECHPISGQWQELTVSFEVAKHVQSTFHRKQEGRRKNLLQGRRKNEKAMRM